MDILFEKKQFTWSLFMGHLVIEKLLKAYYVSKANEQVPITHDLLRIADRSGLTLTIEQKDCLDTISGFNIKARYDDYKFKFYLICTESYTKDWINKIKEFREWIKKQL